MQQQLTVIETPLLTSYIDNNPTLCRVLHQYKNEITGLLFQIQLDATDDTNRDSVGPTILALRKVTETFHLLATKGAVLLAEENKKKQK